MKTKKKILLLGYKKKRTQIVNFLKKKGIIVTEYGQKKITSKTINTKFDLISLSPYFVSSTTS